MNPLRRVLRVDLAKISLKLCSVLMKTQSKFLLNCSFQKDSFSTCASRRHNRYFMLLFK